jgi:DNA-binding MarR family transcriptional regulator
MFGKLHGMSVQSELWGEISRVFIDDKGRRVSTLNEYGLTWMQGIALAMLCRGDEPASMSALAAAMTCDNSQVTAVVDRLETLGLVERRPSAADRRVKLLAVTDEGRELGRTVHEAMKVPPPSIAALSTSDAAAALEILRRAR